MGRTGAGIEAHVTLPAGIASPVIVPQKQPQARRRAEQGTVPWVNPQVADEWLSLPGTALGTWDRGSRAQASGKVPWGPDSCFLGEAEV